MGVKKKLAKIAEAVEGILGDPVKAKKLKKIEALEGFVRQMEAKRAEISSELEETELSPESRALKDRHLGTLDEQIGKANKLLFGMRERKGT